MDYSSSTDSSDEEIFEVIELIPRPRVFRKRLNPLEIYNESEFKNRFRFSKQLVVRLVDIFKENIQPFTQRSCSISALEQLLITLRFYATSAFQILVGDDSKVHKSTVCRVVQKVTHEIASLRPHFIKMPENAAEIREVKTGFHNIRGFPNVLGCIDGTHIPIQSPGGDYGEMYRNRKGFFSINVQVICDHTLKIRDIVARWPGSVHDSTVFNSSRIRAQLETGEYPGSYLLGDSAYPCKKYILTPLLNPLTEGENNYNTSHIQTRNCVERTFGVWKRRFPCIGLGLRVKLDTALAVVIATAVLHNIAIMENEDENYLDENIPENDIDQQPVNQNRGDINAEGNALRQYLIQNVFSN